MIEYWCIVKSRDNHGGAKNPHWTDCHECCSTCKTPCDNPTCSRSPRDVCCWRATPPEWLLAKIDDRAGSYTYNLRRVEYWLKQGHRENDGSWEGEHIHSFRERYGKDFGNDNKSKKTLS